MLILLLSIAAGALLEVFGGMLSYFAKTENMPFQIYAIILYVVGGVIVLAGIIDFIVMRCRRHAARRREEERIDFSRYFNKPSTNRKRRGK